MEDSYDKEEEKILLIDKEEPEETDTFGPHHNFHDDDSIETDTDETKELQASPQGKVKYEAAVLIHD